MRTIWKGALAAVVWLSSAACDGDPAKFTVSWSITVDGAAASCGEVGASDVVITLAEASDTKPARLFPPTTTVACSAGQATIEATSSPYDIEAKLVAADGAVLKSSGTSVVKPMTDGSTTVPYVFAFASAGACDATTCPTGCCDAGGQCLTSARDEAACGTGGNACAACPGAGDTCDANGMCVTPGACGPCANGCCSGEVCVPAGAGQSDTVCGTGGATCAPCNGSDQCTDGVCMPAAGCNATTCANGCCNLEGVCRHAGTAEQNDSTCGTGGETCMSCADIGVCTSLGECGAP